MKLRKSQILSIIFFLIIFVKEAISYHKTAMFAHAAYGALLVMLPVFFIAWMLMLHFVLEYYDLTGKIYFLEILKGSDVPRGLLQAIERAKAEAYEIKDSHRNRAESKGSTAASGFLFGKNDSGRFVCDPAVHGKAPHVFVYGPSGSGKTQSILLPTVSAWPKDSGHILALDISGDIVKTINENPWMRDDPAVIDLNDWHAKVRFDPFGAAKRIAMDAPSDMPKQKIEEAQERKLEQIALCLIPTVNGKDQNPYFVDGARDLLAAGLIYGFFSGKSFGKTLTWLSETKLDDICVACEKTKRSSIVRKVRQFAGQNDRNLSGVRGSMSKVVLNITKNTTLQTIFTPPKPGENAILIDPKMIEKKDIFITCNLQELEVYGAVIGLLFTQFFDYFYSRPLGICEDHPILVLADEIGSYIKYLGDFDNSIRNFRKFGVHVLLCAQDFASLDSAIGKAKRLTIWGNCGWRAILEVSIAEDQKTIADLIGKEKIKKRTESFGSTQSIGYSNRLEYDYVIRPENLKTIGQPSSSWDHGKLVLLGPNGYELLHKIPFWACKAQIKSATCKQYTNKFINDDRSLLPPGCM
jgi:type IV secretory pathway TraG/TraD family ATPase VirD4